MKTSSSFIIGFLLLIYSILIGCSSTVVVQSQIYQAKTFEIDPQSDFAYINDPFKLTIRLNASVAFTHNFSAFLTLEKGENTGLEEVEGNNTLLAGSDTAYFQLHFVKTGVYEFNITLQSLEQQHIEYQIFSLQVKEWFQTPFTLLAFVNVIIALVAGLIIFRFVKEKSLLLPDIGLSLDYDQLAQELLYNLRISQGPIDIEQLYQKLGLTETIPKDQNKHAILQALMAAMDQTKRK